MTIEELRITFPTFTYHRYGHTIDEHGLTLWFEFSLNSEYTFKPTLTIAGVTAEHVRSLAPDELERWIFHIGLVESLSYWKAAASPEIKIKAGPLNSNQVVFWHDLLIQGMGEYFFVNHIDFTPADFVHFSVQNKNNKDVTAVPPLKQVAAHRGQALAINGTTPLLVPVGGGKDSATALGILTKHQIPLSCLVVNPTPAALEVSAAAHPRQLHVVTRKLDPRLLELNRQGFLNGHTPFSALLAFTSSFVGRLLGYSAVVLSNEQSSNEGNVEFHGRTINHQYSKTFEFEQAFQQYLQTYLTNKTAYFSLLRPLYEIQIAKLFSQFPEYHAPFRSCNRGQKTNEWCHECPKCLFVYIMLAPFLDESHLTHTIFHRNLLADLTLLPLALELVGKAHHKPLECVGTHEETIIALYLTRERYREEGQPLPALLTQLDQEVLIHETNLAERAQMLLTAWNDNHALPPALAEILTQELGLPS